MKLSEFIKRLMSLREAIGADDPDVVIAAESDNETRLFVQAIAEIQNVIPVTANEWATLDDGNTTKVIKVW